jgi:hypothetical protein
MIKKTVILFSLVITACTLYEVPSVFPLKVTVLYPDEINDGKPVQNAVVKIVNKQTCRIYEQTTDENGSAKFSIRGGNYDITTSYSEDRITEIDGNLTTKTIVFNGSLTGQVITEPDIDLLIQTEYFIINSGFVIKELYVSGSKAPEGSIYGKDRFIEIYNNSNEILYADGLCFGVVFPNTTNSPSSFVDENGELLDRIPVYSYVAIVPGSGNENYIMPGESFIIALMGLNHKNDPNGNPNSIDLSFADWELYVENGKYPDVPSVPNMFMHKIATSLSTAMAFDQSGTVCILFRLPSKDIQNIFTDPNNYLTAPGSSQRCFMVPQGWIIDGIENSNVGDVVYKRLPNNIDLGYIQHRGSGEKVSIRRKVKDVINGRVVYQDTNNSTEDFLTNQYPQPGVISAY